MAGASSSCVDLHYRLESLVALYDMQNKWAADNDYYLKLAHGNESIVDLGCGTGVLACAYAKRGNRVIGVEPSTEMLKAAKKAPRASCVTWVEDSAQRYRAATPVDLIVMTGHAFQTLLTNADITRALENMYSSLKDGGRAVFETRNPLVKAWEAWTQKNTFEVIHYEGAEVQSWIDTKEVHDDLVTFEQFYLFKGKTLCSQSTLRFTSFSHMIDLIETAGFRVERVDGDWGGTIYWPSCKEMIFNLRR